MCGFVGIVGEKFPDKLKSMLARIEHRGPDARAIYEDPHGLFSFGHQRLSIFDLDSTANQPMRSVDDRFIILFNGELYNSVKLRERIKSESNFTFKTSHSDTEVVLNAYALWGEDCLSRFRGMFSFAIWDNHKKSVFLARDHFGQKPLYIWHYKNLLCFASELRSVAEFDTSSLEVDRLALEKYFAYDCIPAPLTLFKGISKLKAGEWARYDLYKNTLIRKTYWSPSFDRTRRISSDFKNELKVVLNEATRRTLQSDVPVSLLLSGGTDSSVVGKLLTEQYPNLESFSLGFDDQSFDETADALCAAQYLKTKHYTWRTDRQQLETAAVSILANLDEPIGDTGLIPYSILSKKVAKKYKVAIGGDGGDELFFGYDTNKALQYGLSFTHRFKFLVPWITSVTNSLPSNHGNLPCDLKIKRFFKGLNYSPPFWAAEWMSSSSYPASHHFFGNSKFTHEEIFSEALEAWENTSGSIEDKFNSYYFRVYLSEKVLMKVDRASMAYGLEVRSPLLDLDVFSLISQLSIDDLNKNGRKKILHELFPDFPSKIRKKSKKGFGAPVAQMFNPPTFFLPKLRTLNINPQRMNDLIFEHSNKLNNHTQILWNINVLASGWYSRFFK